jgi:hypothetical protein
MMEKISKRRSSTCTYDPKTQSFDDDRAGTEMLCGPSSTTIFIEGRIFDKGNVYVGYVKGDAYDNHRRKDEYENMGGKNYIGHVFIEMNDGTIVDGAYGQVYPKEVNINADMRLRIISPDDPDHDDYVKESRNYPFLNKDVKLTKENDFGKNLPKSIIMNPKMLGEAFQEQEHPRDGGGKFAKKGSSPRVSIADKIVDVVEKNNISDIDEEYLLAPFSRTTDPDSSMQGIKEKWDELAKTNPEIKNLQKELEEYGENINNTVKKQYEETTSLYRGMRTDELDFYIETGRAEPYGYRFISFTMDKNIGMGFGKNAGVTVEFDKDNIKNQKLWNGMDMIIEPNNYDVYSNSVDAEKIGHRYPISFADELEVRSVQFNIENTIKSITLHQDKFYNGDDIQNDLEKYTKAFPNAKVSISSVGFTEAFVELEHPRDNDGKFTDKGEDEFKSTRDITFHYRQEYYKEQVEYYEELFDESEEELRTWNGNSEGKIKLEKRLEAIKNNIKRQEGLIKIADEMSSLIDDNNLFTVIKGDDKHKIEYKGFKNTTDGKPFNKKWDLNLDGKGYFIRVKKEYYVDPATGKVNKNMPLVSGGNGVSSEQFDKETDGKQLLFTNVNNGASTPDWAKEALGDFNHIWNNFVTDYERSSVDVINVNWTTVEKLKEDNKKQGKKGYVLGSVMSREEFDGHDILQHPSVLTINLLEKRENIDYLNTVIHELRHGVWNKKVKGNEKKLNEFTNKILDRGLDKSLTWYVKQKFDELEKMKNDQKEKLERIITKDPRSPLSQSDFEKLNEEEFAEIRKEYAHNIRVMETIVANETHSEYFSVLGSPSNTHIKNFDIENMKSTGSLIEEILYNED